MDPVEIAVLGVSSATLGLLVLLLIGIRAFSQKINQFETNLGQMLIGFIWDESIETIDGKKVAVRKLKPEVGAAIAALAPVLMEKALPLAIDWLKKNIKLGGPQGIMGTPGAGGGLGTALAGVRGIPAWLKPFLPFLEPMIAKFLGETGASSTGNLPANAFVKH